MKKEEKEEKEEEEEEKEERLRSFGEAHEGNGWRNTRE